MLTYLTFSRKNVYSLLKDSDPTYHFGFHSIQKAHTMHLQIHMTEYVRHSGFLEFCIDARTSQQQQAVLYCTVAILLLLFMYIFF